MASMHNVGRIGFTASYVLLGLIVLLVPPLLTPASVPRATGHFEEYCDGVGIFLAKIDGAPASGKLVFFSYMAFPGGTFGGEYIGQGKWSDVSVFADGCVPDGKFPRLRSFGLCAKPGSSFHTNGVAIVLT
jgi:hypothetical protein